MPMGRPSSFNQLPYDSGHYSFPHMFLQHTVEQDRAPHVLPHYPELARHASRQPPRGHRTDRKHHDENRSQNPLRTRSQPLSQGHQDLRRANGDTQHKARFLPSRMELQHLAQTFERGAIILGRRLEAEHHGEAPPKVSQRKREGVVYTPDMVTRFLVEKTIGVTLREYFDEAWSRLRMGESAGEEQQRAFWREYLTRLRSLTIVDPACGSGAFLVAAFDLLASEYQRADKALEAINDPRSTSTSSTRSSARTSTVSTLAQSRSR